MPSNEFHDRWGPRRPRLSWLVLGLVLLVLLVGNLTATADSVASPATRKGAARLFLIDEDGQTLLPLDPQRLTDLPDAEPVAVEPPPDLEERGDDRRLWYWLLSGDGGTLVGVDFAWGQEEWEAEDLTFVVRDGLAGPERGRFHPPALVVTDATRLSHDGRRAVLRRGWVYDAGGGGSVALDPQTWYALDTTDGRVLATITSVEGGTGPGGEQISWVDPAARRLYRLVVAPDAPDPGPWPTQLVVDDLESGQEIGRIDLPEVRAGGGRVGPLVSGSGVPVESFLYPDVAISPDGHHLAIANGDGTALTLIDAERMAVERVIELPAPRPAETIATPAPLEEISGSPYESRVARALFATDGEAVFVAGYEATVDIGSGRMSCRSLPLRRVDLATGATAAGPPVVVWQALAPTAEGIYAVGEVTPGCVSYRDTPFALVRLDATTLAPLARRELRGNASPAFVAEPGG